MSIVKHILQAELIRLEQLRQKYSAVIATLPKGAIARKHRNSQAYVYLAYRVGQKVKFDYVGKDSSDAVQSVEQLIQQRQQYTQLLREVNRDIQEVKKVVQR
jgi:phosphotransferase system HPr-like phosphotransfer protein